MSCPELAVPIDMSPAQIRQLWMLTVALAGCASIAGFEDLSSDCPASEQSCRDTHGGSTGVSGDAGASGSTASGGASGATGSAGSGASTSGGTAGSGGAGSGGNAGAAGTAGADAAPCPANPPRAVSGGPTMAPIRRADGCYWIDTTEVTEGQYAAYLEANPTPVNDALCSAPPDPESQCQGRAPTDSESELPMTCVDWCDADAFCQWAGKTLCRDDFTAIWPGVLNKSDFVFACTESGTNRAPYGPNCGEQACTVGGVGPIAAGQTKNCRVGAADGSEVHDLIGNVEEWTDWCHSDVPRANCTVRGGSFARFDALRCCDQKTELFRRRRLPTLGFRCCAYP